MAAAFLGDSSSMTFRETTLLLVVSSIYFGASPLRAETVAEAGSQAESIVTSAVTGDELAALANDVNLPAWAQLALSPSFTSIEEGRVAVYSPKDAVGTARDWDTQVKVARHLAGRTRTPGQRHWLNLFIKAGEALARKDALRFASAVRALESEPWVGRIAIAGNPNFFTAK